jgi:signal transduction histidine kinase
MSIPLRVLLVEDSQEDAELLTYELERSGYAVVYRRIDTGAFMTAPADNLTQRDFDADRLASAKINQWLLTHVECLEVAIRYLSCDRVDVVLLDLSLPDSFGLNTVKKLQTSVPNIPIIVLTGVDNHALALQSMATGIQDYLVKGQISAPLLERAIRYAIERKKAEAHIRQALERERELNQLKLIHREKMASLGKHVANVAHEITNPVNFIFANLTHVNNYIGDLLALIHLYQQGYTHSAPEIQDKIEEIDLDFLREDLPQMLSSMKLGAERICELVQTLRNFSRLDTTQIRAVNIHEEIDSTLLILRDRLKENSGRPAIQVIKEYGSLPLVECYGGQLNQVFMNIISNAIDALLQLDEHGSKQGVKNYLPTITICTQVLNSHWVRISIKDNGPGMTEAVREQLFDPFFTTKEIGKGTGLGLSISYQIVTEEHAGHLQCISVPGEGAEFILEIPIKQTGQSKPSVNQMGALLKTFKESAARADCCGESA